MELSSLNQADNDILSDKSYSDSSRRCCKGCCFDVKIFLMFLCMLAMTLGFAANGINNVNIPMYEKRFKLRSIEAGFIHIAYDIMGICTLTVGGYFVARYNQSRLLGMAALVAACGSLLMALPHFLTSEYQPDDVLPATCLIGNNETGEVCDSDEKGLKSYMYMLLSGHGLHGIAGSLIYIIGPAFIDGSVSDKQSPIYLGVFYVAATVGASGGYVIGGWLLGKYVDFPKQPPPGQTPLSPAWVGAWWIGFLASSSICFLLVFPLMSFPRVLPGTEKRRKNNKSQVHCNKEQSKIEKSGFGMTVRDIPMNLRLLAKNPTFVCQSFIGALDGLVIGGLATFSPKFLANQFNLSTGWAGILTGIIAIPGIAIGQFLGGVIIKRWKFKVKDNIRFLMVLNILVILTNAAYLANCNQNKIAGVTVDYLQNVTNEAFSLGSSCNSDCRCDTSRYEPVCMDGVEYFSACHAGCAASMNFKTKAYGNCSCASSLDTTSFTSNGSISVHPEAIRGKCKSKCYLLYVFVTFQALGVFLTFMKAVPSITIVLRCVNDNQRSFALSLLQLTARACGTIPGPLLFGAILDNACLVWQEKCETKGSCWIYDAEKMSRNFFLLIISCGIANLTLTIISYNLYTPPREDNSDDDYS